MTTFGSRLAEHNGVGPGFDAMRIVLALSVLFVHTGLLWPPNPAVLVTPIAPFVPLQQWAFDFAILPMFFALSGFLVAGSAERLSLGQFVINRGLRILPALAVEIGLSALVLGPLLTVYGLWQYLADPLFARYFLNIVGAIQYELPGVFLSNPQPNIVNGSLWTVPHEVTCYVVLILCIATGLYRQRLAMLLMTLALFATSIIVFLCGRFGVALPAQEALTHLFVTRGAARLVPLFLMGILLYQYRDRIPYRFSYVLAAIAAYIAIAAFGGPDWITNPIFSFASAPLFAYVVSYAGLSKNLTLPFVSRGDYSYGIYLYGYPLQQAMIQTMPWIDNRTTFFLCSVAAAGLMAVFSWHVVEKPVLRLRRKFSLTARIHTAPRPESGKREARSVQPAVAAE
jgi:peptidoglycan/LPS O-acetylase OafA/YrhL